MGCGRLLAALPKLHGFAQRLVDRHASEKELPRRPRGIGDQQTPGKSVAGRVVVRPGDREEARRLGYEGFDARRWFDPRVVDLVGVCFQQRNPRPGAHLPAKFVRPAQRPPASTE